MKSEHNSIREKADRENLVGNATGKSLEQRQRLLDTNSKYTHIYFF